MNTDIQSVTVKYQTQQNYCSCCEQKLPNPKTSKEKEREFTKDDAECYADWSAAVEYPEDIEKMVAEFVYETIYFWSVDSGVKVVVEPSEIEKVKEFILREFATNQEATT